MEKKRKKRAKLVLKREHLDFIGEHGADEYPHEACGLMLGHIKESEAEIIFICDTLRRARNLSDNPYRFNLSPQDFMKIQDEADEKGFEIIGVYHTHPDHPPIASQFDLESAIEGLFYIIMSVRDGKPAEFKGWVLDSEGEKRKFVEAEISILDES